MRAGRGGVGWRVEARWEWGRAGLGGVIGGVGDAGAAPGRAPFKSYRLAGGSPAIKLTAAAM